MNSGVIGATGRIDQRIVAEALQRGHNVTAFTSSAAKIPADKGKVVEQRVVSENRKSGTRWKITLSRCSTKWRSRGTEGY